MKCKNKQTTTATQNKTTQHKNKFNQGIVLFNQEGGWWFLGGPPERKWHIEGDITRKCHFERWGAHNKKINDDPDWSVLPEYHYMSYDKTPLLDREVSDW